MKHNARLKMNWENELKKAGADGVREDGGDELIQGTGVIGRGRTEEQKTD